MSMLVETMKLDEHLASGDVRVIRLKKATDSGVPIAPVLTGKPPGSY